MPNNQFIEFNYKEALNLVIISGWAFHSNELEPEIIKTVKSHFSKHSRLSITFNFELVDALSGRQLMNCIDQLNKIIIEPSQKLCINWMTPPNDPLMTLGKRLKNNARFPFHILER
ncbi:SiaC family regulatory phosphoprotein [Marinoscillum sp.]|uniref:SiaC family regulatory phosphoprotein n=1 Tax=Marinoscillum sp. TaxID=2024838 RepID=UPI003BA8BA69